MFNPLAIAIRIAVAPVVLALTVGLCVMDWAAAVVKWLYYEVRCWQAARP